MAKTIKIKDMNFLAVIEQEEKGKKKRRIGTVPLIAIIGIVLGIAAYIILNQMESAQLFAEIQEKQDYIKTNQSDYDEAMSIEAEAADMTAKSEQIGTAVANIQSHPDLSADELRQILELAGDRVRMTNISFDRDSGTLSFSATCDTAAGVPIFISQLRLSGLFADISYQGYSGRTESSALGGTSAEFSSVYSFSVTCAVVA